MASISGKGLEKIFLYFFLMKGPRRTYSSSLCYDEGGENCCRDNQSERARKNQSERCFDQNLYSSYIKYIIGCIIEDNNKKISRTTNCCCSYQESL